MRKIKTISVMLCLALSIGAYGQSSKKQVLKVSYVATPLSNFMVELLKKQISNPQELSGILDKTGQYKIYSDFYEDTNSHQSLFIFNHADEVTGISITGYPNFVYRKADGNFTGQESFLGKDVNFKGKVQTLKWVITDEEKKIKDYPCRKAHLEGDNSTYAWFTADIPVQSGPYIFLGLPGLVLEANTSFQNLYAETIAYQNKQEMENALKKVDNEKERSRSRILIKEVFAKKNNFKKMVQNQK